MRWSAIPLTFLLLSLMTAGCALVEAPGAAARRMTRMFTPNPTDWTDDGAEDNGEWDFVGDEGRAGYTREQDPDPWFGRYLMSEKARAIERNFGVDY